MWIPAYAGMTDYNEHIFPENSRNFIARDQSTAISYNSFNPTPAYPTFILGTCSFVGIF